MTDRCLRCSLFNDKKSAERRPIKGYGKRPKKGPEERYQVSAQGDIEYWDDHEKKWKAKKPRRNKDGYYYVRLSIPEKKTKQNIFVHRLVAEAFIDNPENKETVNHKKSVKSCNCSANLEWMTQKENNEDYEKRKKKIIKAQ